MSLRHASEEDVDGNATAIPDVPDAPTSQSAADVGTSRAFIPPKPVVESKEFVLNEDTCLWEETLPTV